MELIAVSNDEAAVLSPSGSSPVSRKSPGAVLMWAARTQCNAAQDRPQRPAGLAPNAELRVSSLKYNVNIL